MKGERGYSMVEALIAIAMTGFIVTMIALAMQQIVTVPERSDDQVDALHTVQNAAHWITLDGQMAESAAGSSNLTLTMPSTNIIGYTLLGTNLIRYSGGDNQTIARDIIAANFTVSGRNIYFTIAAKPDSRWDISTNQTYQVYMRPNG
jgi:type II secretory pathway pseudopilin PulG